MSSIEIHTLADSYAEGKISKEAFRSLYSTLAIANFPDKKKRKSFSFRNFCRQCYHYLLITVVLVVVYFVLSFINPGMFFQADSHKYIDLPKDIQLAAEKLSMTPNWHPLNIEEFISRWSALSENEQKEYQGEDWFKAFELAASLQQTQQKIIIQGGSSSAALESLKALDNLAVTKGFRINTIASPAKKAS